MELERRELPEEEVSGEPKKSYKSPELMVHGTVGQITKDLGTVPTDGVLGSIQVPG